MRIPPFELERWQSHHEHCVAHNLSESGVHPLTVGELCVLPGGDAPLDPAALADVELGYPQTNGEDALRARIAALYDGAGPEQVLVTHGGAEANHVAVMALVEPGDEVVVSLPNYMQVAGLVEGLGARVVPWRLDPARGWRPSVGELAELVGERTRLVLVTTPNNPTGRILREDVLDAVAAAAERVGAWVLADEIYRGAELAGGDAAPSMWGRGARVLCSAGLSKAYGLPGLRTGWLACSDADFVEELWARKDYSSITNSPLTQRLAVHALDPERRAALLARTRAHLASNLEVVRGWAQAEPRVAELVEPEAGAIAWLRYDAALPSRELVERARVEHGTLLVPGAQFGHDGWLRIGYGAPRESVVGGLDGLGRVLASL